MSKTPAKTLDRVGRRANVCQVFIAGLCSEFPLHPDPMTVVTWTGSEEYLPNRDTRALKPDGVHPSLLSPKLKFSSGVPLFIPMILL